MGGGPQFYRFDDTVLYVIEIDNTGDGLEDIVGLIFLYGGRIFDSEKMANNRIVEALPVFRAFFITCVGAVICYTSVL